MDLGKIIKEAVKEGYKEGRLEYEQYVEEQSQLNKSDKISKTQARKYAKRGRIEALIKGGYLEIEKSGTGRTSAIYVSRKQLLSLKDLVI